MRRLQEKADKVSPGAEGKNGEFPRKSAYRKGHTKNYGTLVIINYE